MKKILSLITVAAIAVSCGSKSSKQESLFIQEQPAIEEVTEETIVNSVGEANAARFTLEKEDETIGVVLDPGNIATAVVRGPEIGKIMMQGKWEIVENQYKLTLLAPLCTEDEATIILIPQTFDNGQISGGDEVYKIVNLELMKIVKVVEKGVGEDIAKGFIKKMYNNRLFLDEKFLLKH